MNAHLPLPLAILAASELLDPRVRRSVEDHIEALIALLDEIDPDPDLEPNGDHEGSLGWPHAERQTMLFGSTEDGEPEACLGWSANVGQLHLDGGTEDGDSTAPERFGKGFVRCARDDSEDDDPGGAEHDGCEPDDEL